MNTIFYFAGTSGAGKSTRIYALIRFLEDTNRPPTGYLTHRGRTVGREYLNSFSVIGKEYIKRGMRVWQGCDSYTKWIQNGGGQPNLYAFFYEEGLKQNLIVDSAALLRSHRSRPIMTERYGGNIKTYSRFYWFDDFEVCKKRIFDRTGGRILTENSSMWKTNQSFKNQKPMQEEELKKVAFPERYEIDQGIADEPVDTIGRIVLERIGQETLIPEFCEYAKTFIQNQSAKRVSAVHLSEELF